MFNILYSMPTGFYFQFMKINTNFIFALIKAYRLTKNLKYKNAINKWILNVKQKLFRNGQIYSNWSPMYVNKKPALLVDQYVLIDILCDYYAFVENDMEHLMFAKELANNEISLQMYFLQYVFHKLISRDKTFHRLSNPANLHPA